MVSRISIESFGAAVRRFRSVHRETLLTQDPRAMAELAKEAAPLAAFAKMPMDQFLASLARRCLSDVNEERAHGSQALRGIPR